MSDSVAVQYRRIWDMRNNQIIRARTEKKGERMREHIIFVVKMIGMGLVATAVTVATASAP